MIENIRIKRRIAAVVLTVGMVISPLGLQLPSYAAPADDTSEFGELITSKNVDQGTVHEVEGEAIVCFRQDENVASQKEEVVKEEQEKEIEVESYVDEAEALLMVESPDADLAAADAAEDSEDLDGAAPTGMLKSNGASDSESDLASELPGVITVVHSDHLSTAELIAELEEREDVIYAEPNYIYSPNGEDLTDEQWGNPISSSYGMGVENWNIYENEKPKPKVDTSEQVVAVIDSGVDYTHEDLADVMWADGEDYEELVKLGGGKYGYNAVRENSEEVPYDTSDPMDDFGHGTHCAGIIAAAWNGYGVSGVTSGARIMALKTGDDQGILSTDAVIRSYNYMIAAKKAGVNICASNNSYGGAAESQTIILLTAEAGKNGIVCCFSAGNDGMDLDYANNLAPLRGSVPQVVIVGASNVDGNITGFSNYGRRDVDVFAPGDSILSTVPMGTGMPTADSGTFMDGEIPCEVDYSEKTEPGDAAMDLMLASGTETMVQSGEDGKNVLHLASEDGMFWLDSRLFDDLADLKGGFIRIYVDGEYNAVFMARELDAEGNVGEDIGQTVIRTKAGWNDIGFSVNTQFARRAEKKNMGVYFLIAVARGELSENDYLNEVDIRCIRLTDESGNYAYKDGTSMATPYVTGAVAVLASAFPEDSAEKLAARVRGSVLPVSQMTDKCLSGGIFRLDKALAGDTVPVVKTAFTEGSTVRVRGYFFGEDQGTVRVAGRNCTVSAWSDTEIAAVLPEDIPDGEARVDIASAAGKEGHNWFNYSRPKEQYDSLPLPGVTVSDTGMYVVDEEAKATYSDFYYGTPAAMTALDGSLYVFFVTEKNGTVIYRYQIAEQSWNRICSTDGYYPKGAVCTWNGKALFLAQNDEKKTNVIGVFDPKTNGVDWTVYRDDVIEESVRMVNTGAAIYIIGGRELTDPDPEKQQKITTLRKLDPETMKISDISGEDFSFEGDNPMIAAVSKETFYVCAEHETDNSDDLELCKITIDQEGSKEVAMEPVEIDEDINDVLVDLDGNLKLTGVATEQGFFTLGPVRVDEEGRIVEDNFMLGYDGQSFVAEKKIISQRPVYMAIAAGCAGKIYVLGITKGTDAGCTFTAIDADTIPAKEGQELSDHRWDDGVVTIPAKCTEDGVRTYTCIDCGKTKKETIPKTGHKPVVIPGVPATEETEGMTEGSKCSVCGEILAAQEVIPKLTPSETEKTGWMKESGKWYYYVKGVKQKGWKQLGNKWYFFKNDGSMAANEWCNGYWLNKDGTWTYKKKATWKKDETGWWFGCEGWYAKNQWQKIDGKWYFFDREGYMLKNAYQKDASGKIWYLEKNGVWDEKESVIGWKQDSKGWKFFLYGGDYLKNTWKMINGNWYYFKADGYMAQNEFVRGWWCNKNGVQSDPVKYS